MSKYEKPSVMELDSVSEGVYMASGAGSESDSSSFSYSLNTTAAWDGHRNYDITLKNNTGSKVDSITVKVKKNGNVTSVGGGVTGAIEGDYVTITSNNWGNGFEAGTSASFYVAVTGTGEFSLE